MSKINNYGAGSVGYTQSVQMDGSGSYSASTESAPPLLPTPSTDPVAAIAQLSVQLAQGNQDIQRDTATAQDQIEDAADAQRISDMKHKAQMTLDAGLANGASQVAEGLCTLGSAVEMSKGAAEVDPKSGVARTAEADSKYFDAAGKGASGAGKISETLFKKAADDADVDIAKDEAVAKQAKRSADALRKGSDAAGASADKLNQIVAQLAQEKLATDRALSSVKM